MKTSIFAIYDIKAQAFGQPFFMISAGLAARSFTEACLKPDSDFGKYPRDFILNEIGEYDDGTATITSLNPMEICSADTALKQYRKNIRLEQNLPSETTNSQDEQTDNTSLPLGEPDNQNGALI